MARVQRSGSVSKVAAKWCAGLDANEPSSRLKYVEWCWFMMPTVYVMYLVFGWLVGYLFALNIVAW